MLLGVKIPPCPLLTTSRWFVNGFNDGFLVAITPGPFFHVFLICFPAPSAPFDSRTYGFDLSLCRICAYMSRRGYMSLFTDKEVSFQRKSS